MRNEARRFKQRVNEKKHPTFDTNEQPIKIRDSKASGEVGNKSSLTYLLGGIELK